MKTLHILIVGAHPLVRSGMRTMLQVADGAQVIVKVRQVDMG